MNFKISPDRRTLTIFFAEQERANLRELYSIHTDEALHDCLEGLIANSELEWINPANTGGLTDAPMFGILGEAQPLGRQESLPNYGLVGVGCWGSPPTAQVSPILERWAFMDYQVRSVLEDLRDRGEAVFINGE